MEFCLRALLFVPLLLPRLRPFPVTVYSSTLPLCANLVQDRQANLDAAVAGVSLMHGSSGNDGSSVAEQCAPRPSHATHNCGQDALFLQLYGMCKQLPKVSPFYQGAM
ncbi:unnamed protein product [Ectocarpus sp. 8 AP-2014]